jgi:hypothetical protein
MVSLRELLPAPGADPMEVVDAFGRWAEASGRPLYTHQEDAILALAMGDHVVLATPTGSGKSLVAMAGVALALNARRRAVWTAPIKALVAEKFFDLVDLLGAEQVGLATGGRDLPAGQAQTPGQSGGVGIEHPAAELFEPRFRGKPRHTLVVENMRDDVGARVLLGVQAVAACIGFPGDTPQRIARLERPQAGKVFFTDRAGLRASSIGRGERRRHATLRGFWPDDCGIRRMYDGPRAEEAKRVGGRNDEAIERNAAATPRRQDQRRFAGALGRQVCRDVTRSFLREADLEGGTATGAARPASPRARSASSVAPFASHSSIARRS